MSSVLQNSLGTLFQLLGPWYENFLSPYNLVLVVATLRMFGSDDEVVLQVYTQLKVPRDIVDMQ